MSGENEQTCEKYLQRLKKYVLTIKQRLMKGRTKRKAVNVKVKKEKPYMYELEAIIRSLKAVIRPFN